MVWCRGCVHHDTLWHVIGLHIGSGEPSLEFTLTVVTGTLMCQRRGSTRRDALSPRLSAQLGFEEHVAGGGPRGRWRRAQSLHGHNGARRP